MEDEVSGVLEILKKEMKVIKKAWRNWVICSFLASKKIQIESKTSVYGMILKVMKTIISMLFKQ